MLAFPGLGYHYNMRGTSTKIVVVSVYKRLVYHGIHRIHRFQTLQTSFQLQNGIY
jgi:hypothetical protein